MRVDVLVAWSTDRAPMWAWCRQRWRGFHPEWDLVEVHATDPWNKGRTLNPAIRGSDADVVVLADCDLVIAPDVMRVAVAAAAHRPWVVPHGVVYRLNRHRTAELLLQPALDIHPAPLARSDLERTAYENNAAGGGLVVASRSALLDVGGFDERFDGWGREDISLAAALDTLIGAHHRVGGDCWHLHHPRPGYDATRANLRLGARYADANGKPDAMRALIAEQHQEVHL